MSLQPPGRGSRLTQDTRSSGMGGSHTLKGKAYLESPSISHSRLELLNAGEASSWPGVVSGGLVVTLAAG